MSQFTDYLKILSLPKDFTSDQLKDNYRKLVKKYHPDVATGNSKKFQLIEKAYQNLSDPQKRKVFFQNKRIHELQQRPLEDLYVDRNGDTADIRHGIWGGFQQISIK